MTIVGAMEGVEDGIKLGETVVGLADWIKVGM